MFWSSTRRVHNMFGVAQAPTTKTSHVTQILIRPIIRQYTNHSEYVTSHAPTGHVARGNESRHTRQRVTSHAATSHAIPVNETKMELFIRIDESCHTDVITTYNSTLHVRSTGLRYGVASISRFLKIIGLICRISSLL